MYRLLLKAVGLLCLVVGTAGAIQGVGQLLEAAHSERWPQSTGSILASSVASGGSARKWYEARISYRYEVASQVYSGNTISYAGGTTSQAVAQDLVRAFPVGASVPVFYDPANPSRAYLRPGASWETSLPVAVALAAMLGGILMLLDARRR